MQNLVKYTLEEVSTHDIEEDCWIIIEGKVYDVTSYLNFHPGGGKLILEWAGKDATEQFKEAKHSTTAIQQMEKYLIGEISN